MLIEVLPTISKRASRMALNRVDLLDDIIAVSKELEIDINSVSYKTYASVGSFSEKTVYAKFHGCGWDKILEFAEQRALGEFSDEEEPVEELTPVRITDSMAGIDIDLIEIEEDIPLDLDFDLEKAIRDGIETTTSLGVPEIHEFKVRPGDIIVGIPDIHSPFFNRGWLVWVVSEIKALLKTTTGKIHVIQLGDGLDLYSMSRHDRIKSLSPMKEIELGVHPLKQMWRAITSLTNTVCYQLIGNHDTRSERFCIKQAELLKDFVPSAKKLLTFENVFTVNNEKDGILFRVEGSDEELLCIHGYLSDSLAHVRKHGVNVMHAHLHRGSIQFFTGKFSMDCGFGGDPKSWAFAYSNSVMKKEWNLGLGVVEILKNGQLQPILKRYFE